MWLGLRSGVVAGLEANSTRVAFRSSSSQFTQRSVALNLRPLSVLARYVHICLLFIMSIHPLPFFFFLLFSFFFHYFSFAPFSIRAPYHFGNHEFTFPLSLLCFICSNFNLCSADRSWETSPLWHAYLGPVMSLLLRTTRTMVTEGDDTPS